jgi:hypothetical protein
MSYWVFPAGGVGERVTCVFSPEGVIGVTAWARETQQGMARRSEMSPTNPVLLLSVLFILPSCK